MIKEVKEFWDARPCNIRHSDKEIGTKDYFEEVENKKFRVEPHIVEFSEFRNWEGKKVLEIGCGIGTAAINFARAGAIYTGFELSEKSLELTRKRFDVYGYKGSFYSGNAEELSQYVPIEKYDLIYSFGVIHHSPNPRKILDEIKKYMDHKSVLKVMIYAKNSWKSHMIEAGLDQPEAQAGCPIAMTYTEDEAKDLFSGYELTSIKQDHLFPFEIDSYKKGIYQKQPWFESMPDEMFKTLERKLGWHLLIDAKIK